MATIQMTPPVTAHGTITTNAAGPGAGQGAKQAIRQTTLAGAMASGDVLVGPRLQGGAIITDAYKVNGAAGNLGTPSNPTAFNTRPFAPYVVPPGGEVVQLVATASGGAANDVVSMVVTHVPRNT